MDFKIRSFMKSDRWEILPRYFQHPLAFGKKYRIILFIISNCRRFSNNECIQLFFIVGCNPTGLYKIAVEKICI